MKLLSYNVNGLRAAIKKGVLDFLLKENADIIAFQEVKALQNQVDLSQLYEAGYKYIYFNSAVRKGYSGTCVLSKIEAESVSYGLGSFDNNEEGRVITLEFEKFYFICVYTPNSKDQLTRLEYRMNWDEEFAKYLKKIDKTKPLIATGDFNVAHEEIDLKNPDTNHHNPGFSDQEREGFGNLLSNGFIDTFRHLYPNKIEYSWFSTRTAARDKCGLENRLLFN